MPEHLPVMEAEFTLLKKERSENKGVRGAQRYRCRLATLGRLIFGDKFEHAWVHDLSKLGVGLILSRLLAANTAMVVRLKGDSNCLELPATVVHSTQQVDGSWRVGCTFDRKLTADELDALL